MDAGRFRSDATLRPSAYHLTTWAVLAAVAAFSRTPTARVDVPLPYGLLLVVLLVLGWMLALVHERRAAKIVPEAVAEGFPSARPSFWSFTLFGTLLVTATTLAEHGGAGLVLLGLGTLLAWWSVWRPAPYTATGLLVATAGALPSSTLGPEGSRGWYGIGALLILAAASAGAVNRRYLWPSDELTAAGPAAR